MYFKTKKDSETGKKFQALIDRSHQFVKEAEALAVEIGFKSFRFGYGCYQSGFSSVIFDTPPDSKFWKKAETGFKNEYMPKLNTKEGKAIYEKMKALGSIHINELNKCVGFDETWKTIGFKPTKHFFLFNLREDWTFTPPDDCEEITCTEFKEADDLPF